MNMTSPTHYDNADFADFGIERDEEKTFPTHCLPQVAQEYLREISRVHGVCDALPGSCMLGTLSMALGSGVELHIPNHRVRPNLFIMGFAQSAVGKGVVFSRCLQPLLDYERRAVAHWREETLPKVKATKRILLRRQEMLDKQVSKMPSTPAAELQELTAIEANLSELERNSQEPCMLFSEATREKIAEMVSRSPRETLASASAEARGCFKVMMGRYNAKTDEDVFVALWSGDYYKVSRINRPDTVLRNPCLSLLWLAQPDVLDQLLAADCMIESGLMARTLLFQAIPMHLERSADVPISQSAQMGWHALVSWVIDASRVQQTLTEFHCEPEVVALMATFDNCLIRRRRSGGDLTDVDSFAARWVEQTWRIMLVLHAVKQRILPPHHVSIETAREAIQLMDWFATQQLLLLTARREKKHDERFEALLVLLRNKPDQCCSLRDMSRRHGFQEAEVRAIVQNHPGILVFKELRAQGPGRSSPGVALACEMPPEA